jgi:DNA-directed RNA polymerase I, II, and III subunit RPABC2
MSKNKIKNEKINDLNDNNILLESEKNSDTFKSDILNLQKISTLNRLTKYERARILGTRAAQIQNGMPPVFLEEGKIVGIPNEFKDSLKNSIDIAKLELKLKSTPLIIRRKLPSGKVDERTVQELE